MGGPAVQPMVWVGPRSQLALNQARMEKKKCRRRIFAAFALGLLPLHVAVPLMQSNLAPNPRKSRPVVCRHSPPSGAATARHTTKGAGRLAKWFMLADHQQFVSFAAILRHPAVVRGEDGCVASRSDALLVYVFRLHNEGEWGKLLEHPVMSAASADWSVSKGQSIFRAVGQLLHAEHGGRVTWSGCIMGRHALYAAAVSARMPPPLRLFFQQQNIRVSYLGDGTRRPKARAMAGPNGENFQRLDHNSVKKRHDDVFITVTAPDGCIGACSGPHHGATHMDVRRATLALFSLKLSRRLARSLMHA